MAIDVRMNDGIRYPKMKLVMPDGKMYGEINLYEARNLANEYGLDLVEVQPPVNGNLPICKLIDYGKQKYKEEKSKKKNNINTNVGI